MAERNKGTFPGDTINNPNAHCKAITLRSGAVVQPLVKSAGNKKTDEEVVVEEEKEEKEKKEKKDDKGVKDDGNQGSPQRKLMKWEKKKAEEKKDKSPIVSPYAKVPYPQRLKQERLKQQYSRFMEMIKKVEVNIPFAEALESMPNYAKVMKDLLSKKRKLKDYEIVALTEACSAIIQKKLPPKLKDPDSFSIPIAIGNVEVGRALCDLGSSINLMPLSVCNALGIHEMKPTSVSLQLADRSIKRPEGVIEDVLVKVYKFIFPADFVILNMEEDAAIPLLLGRPFLATARAMVDVEQGKLMLRMNEETMTIDVFESIKHPFEAEDCYKIDLI